MTREDGFSFVELMIVLVIMAILLAIGITGSTWFRMRTECRMNRHNVAHQTYLLAIDEQLETGDIPVRILIDHGLLSERQGHCPFGHASARVGDADPGDYTAHLENGRVTEVECRQTQDGHSWVESVKRLGKLGWSAPWL